MFKLTTLPLHGLLTPPISSNITLEISSSINSKLPPPPPPAIPEIPVGVEGRGEENKPDASNSSSVVEPRGFRLVAVVEERSKEI